MSTEHTPGPWKAKPADKPNWVVMAGDIVVVRLARNDYPERNKVNARLIAAAPDLLAACERLLGQFEKKGGFWLVKDKTADYSQDCLDGLEAAISAATVEDK